MYLGIDFGTTGARACVIDAQKNICWEQRIAYPDATAQTAQDWQSALFALMGKLPTPIAASLRGIAIDGTSGTVLQCDAALQPIGPALLYNDARAEAQAKQLSTLAPSGSNVCTSSSGLSKALWLAQYHPGAHYLMHQADWLTALLSGRPGISDYHNALKSGYDVQRLCWPDWIQALPIAPLLPSVVAPGSVIGKVSSSITARYGIASDCTIHASTTDSIAAFMASEVNDSSTGVTSLGTTLVLKQLSPTRIESPKNGIYSHRYGDLWLVGGASNAGAGVLRSYFNDAQLSELSAQIDAHQESPLDYYPLPKRGERFPVYDPALDPRLSPRPKDDADFLHGILLGLARIEAAGYACLAELGAPPIRQVISNGGGAHNQTWSTIRSLVLHHPVCTSAHIEAAYGSALLARKHDVLATKS